MSVDEASPPLAKRLWIYQAERFPLAKTAPLIAVFSVASISVSAHLAGRPLPGFWAFAVAFAVTMILFFEMRACDEVKDAEDDRRFRPERPVPRGLVTLRLIVGLGIAGFFATLLIAAAYAPSLVWPLALVQAWLALMTVEFFAPDWLRDRPVPLSRLAYGDHAADRPVPHRLRVAAGRGLAAARPLDFSRALLRERLRDRDRPKTLRQGERAAGRRDLFGADGA
ncbi:UbiA family prenyltransferase [Chenggangzhangella methanolivorans]|uniref:UbiA family prenyltransferase n=1 Tax=Chenggangzhangella methanolivorans TaxID=1437009 RepID=A0A9E6RD79_9HYPH|nr:UbiA family prenyltransferase [Chenggangzhangella methanolivorans]QZO01164.1 UbiA family prenyltransferase [Chenggangzhangella methanolivorans]